MKRIITAFVSAAALMASPALASSPSFTPANAVINLTGQLDVKQSVALSCDADFTIQFNGTTSASLTNADLSGGFLWLCGSVGFPNLPRPVEIVQPVSPAVGKATQLKIVGLTVSTISGSCTGDVYVDWDDANQIASFNNATFGSPVCSIDGDLEGDNPAASAELVP